MGIADKPRWWTTPRIEVPREGVGQRHAEGEKMMSHVCQFGCGRCILSGAKGPATCFLPVARSISISLGNPQNVVFTPVRNRKNSSSEI